MAKFAGSWILIRVTPSRNCFSESQEIFFQTKGLVRHIAATSMA